MAEEPARVTINDGERVLPVRAGEPVLFALMGARIFVPSACGGRGICGQCRLVIPGARGGPTDAEIALVSPADRARGVRLSCQVPVVGEVAVRLPTGSLAARPYRARVLEIRDETPDMRRLILELEEPGGMRFEAGQYVQLVRPGTEDDERPVYRAYSIASAPSSTRLLTLLVARVAGEAGELTRFVFQELTEGRRVALNGPLGTFTLRPSRRELLFVAGGSGYAPIRSILMDAAERGLPRPATLYFAARSLRDLFLLDEIRQIQRSLPALRFVPVLSRPLPEDRWQGERGGIAAALARLLPTLDNHDVYLCGSPGMVDACIAALRSRGLAEDRLVFDRFA
ncbi:MAG TPA: FAD-binding oxidoreductase [Spirochaetia bacterium]|nr:FAD-binding oxidoreductase [Spirochaetia bacterium]